MARKATKTKAKVKPVSRSGKVRKKKSAKLKLDVNIAPVKKTPASAFYAGVLDAAEKRTRMMSNSMRYLKPLSTGSLQINRALSGGLYNAFGSVAGPEGSGKTTLIYHCMSSALNQDVNFTSFIDAEGTLNEQFAGNVFSTYGMDFRAMVDDKSSPFRYYRRNVIETVFDLLHFVLRRMPDKIWVPETESWGYIIPKNNKHFSALAEGLGLKADKSLTTAQDFVCPTDNDRIEGAAFLDSLAAMVTESDDEAEERGKRRAAEAAAYSEHLKRVVSRLASKGLVFYATNQVRKVPGQTYGDPLYEPGGEAIKFYSSHRLRINAVSSPEGGEVQRDKKVTSQAIEPSVHRDGAVDRYKYKKFKNTKNKMGFPGHVGMVRVWVADAFGNVRGFDPFYDTLAYLEDTNQIRKVGLKKGKMQYAFQLKESFGKKRARMYNSISAFSYLALKRLVLSEVEGSKKLLMEAADEMGINARFLLAGKLRAQLFLQLTNDKSLLQVTEAEKKAKKKDSDDDDDDDAEEL